MVLGHDLGFEAHISTDVAVALAEKVKGKAGIAFATGGGYSGNFCPEAICNLSQ